MLTIEDLLSKIDIVEFLSQYVDLVQKDGEWWGLSPLADPPEKTPSFSVRRETGRFYCFSTGIGGTLITFLKYYYHISSRKAIELLRQYAGLEGEQVSIGRKMAATDVCQRFSPKKAKQKPSSPKILPQNCMERYENNPSALQIWQDEGISAASMARFQVRYDPFSNRIVYPIRNLSGDIVNIGGRTLDPDFKAKNLRKYCYFYGWGGGMDVIFGVFENLQAIREKKEIILFEGAKSVLLADTFHVQNTGAILTSHLSPAQLRILLRLGCRVVFALDKDVNILADHNIKQLKRYLPVEYLFDREGLLGPKDAPVDRGKEVFQSLYANRYKYR